MKLTTLLFVASLAQRTLSQCFLPNGTDRNTLADVVAHKDFYKPCKTGEHSMCCNTLSGDVCQPSTGLCYNALVGYWRESCTDPTWQSPNCVKLCISSTTLSAEAGGIPEANTDILLTNCTDGSYCCGSDAAARTCCEQGKGRWLVNGTVYDSKPASLAASSTSSSSAPISTTAKTFSTSAAPSTQSTSLSSAGGTPSPTQPPVSPSQSSSAAEAATGPSPAVVGGAVGGVIGGVALLSIVGIGMCIVRKGRADLARARARSMNNAGPPTESQSQSAYMSPSGTGNAYHEFKVPLGNQEYYNHHHTGNIHGPGIVGEVAGNKTYPSELAGHQRWSELP